MTPEEHVLAALVRRGLATVAAQPEADTWHLGRGTPPTTRWNAYGRPLGAPPRLCIDRAKMARDAAGQARRKERKEQDHGTHAT